MLVIAGIIFAVFFMQVARPYEPKYKALYYAAYQMVVRFNQEMSGSNIDKAIITDDNLYCNFYTENANITGLLQHLVQRCSLQQKSSPYGNITGCFLYLIFHCRTWWKFISRRITTDPLGAYRIVTVNINGTAAPETLGEDIVSFLVMDSGDVIPLDTPADMWIIYRLQLKFLKTQIKQGQDIIRIADDEKFISYKSAFLARVWLYLWFLLIALPQAILLCFLLRDSILQIKNYKTIYFEYFQSIRCRWGLYPLLVLYPQALLFF